MPKFLTQNELYRLLQRELPEGVYPDGQPSAFYSTAENDSVASVAATGYANLESIYNNYWPQTADEKITDWEITAFGKPLEASFTLEERRDRVVAKLRSKKGITRRDMIEAVQSIIGTDKNISIRTWSGCGAFSGWRIGVSLLGYDTYLGSINLLRATGPNLCSSNPSDFGLTIDEWKLMREAAYTYEVVIDGYIPSQRELAAINAALDAAEPARSKHVITLLSEVVTVYFGFVGDANSLGFSDLNNSSVGGNFKSLI